ncbi:hypothetical protein H3H36_23330 [Duganella sp. FT3S]|uniref:Uncharacterized protein n=1 Tax=Rugamonas fusca TaxID=2758568 RepID=A0A7W2I985_9BURK|nr:hypothetical protein [Rugamonas fusca]MBA5608286.1 hypothetical protein [Rugamonas fusca]
MVAYRHIAGRNEKSPDIIFFVVGTIQQKRSDTQNKNLSQPIPGFGPNTTLRTMREKTGQVSEKDVRQAAKKMGK